MTEYEEIAVGQVYESRDPRAYRLIEGRREQRRVRVLWFEDTVDDGPRRLGDAFPSVQVQNIVSGRQTWISIRNLTRKTRSSSGWRLVGAEELEHV